MAVGFLGLTIALTYPQITHLSSAVGLHYDALFSVWRLAWIAHQLPRDPLHLFDANIFYPERGTLAYSDALLLPGLVGSPLIWIGASPVLVYNLLILLSFVASGTAMYVLVRTLTGSMSAAWFSGVVFAFQPYRFGHYSQLELLCGWWIPLALWALHKMLDRHRLRDGALVGLFVALQAWSCLYYGVFLVTALIVLTLVMAPGRSIRQLSALGRAVTTGLIVCALLIGPYAMPYESHNTIGPRSAQEVRDWSPTLLNYIATPGGNWLYGARTARFGHLEGVLFPGLVALGAAVFGTCAPINRRRVAYLVLLLLAFDMSCGLNGFTYRLFYVGVWPYQGLRVPARMFVVVSAALAVLGGEGMARLLGWIKTPALRGVVVSTLVALVVAESISTPIALQAVPVKPPSVYTWLKVQPDAVIFEWPVPRASSLGLTEAPLYMYYSTFHWQHLVNGYSGYYPLSYIKLLDTVLTFPHSEAIRYLQRLGVRYVIAHSAPAPDRYEQLGNELAQHIELRPVMVDRTGSDHIAVYQLSSLR